MSAILIADDARSWYESGPIRDVTIKDNRFIDCASPVINIAPENIRYDGPVHQGITIEGNAFTYSNPNANPFLISTKAVDGLTVRRNTCDIPPIPSRLPSAPTSCQINMLFFINQTICLSPTIGTFYLPGFDK